MPFEKKRAPLILSAEEIEDLENISKSASESARAKRRALILTSYAKGQSINSIAIQFQISRPTVERLVDRALANEVISILDDLPRSGRPRVAKKTKKPRKRARRRPSKGRKRGTA